jgi:CTP:molybdopterin cytidylyltransferase MocA
MRAILLGAGLSRRARMPKQLYPVGSEYLIDVQIDILSSYGYRPVVILGHMADEILKKARVDCDTIVNEKYRDGMLSSVAKAFSQIPGEDLLFFHIDRRIPARNLIDQLVSIAGNRPATLLCDGERIPPIYIPYSYGEFLAESKVGRLDRWIESVSARTLECDDKRLLCNGNYPEDLKRCFDSY